MRVIALSFISFLAKIKIPMNAKIILFLESLAVDLPG